MRRCIALALIGLVAAAPVRAQFEGTVTMKMTPPANSNTGDITMSKTIESATSKNLFNMTAIGRTLQILAQ